MKTSSAKAKGRRAAQEVKDLLLKYAKDLLQEDDIFVTSSGDTGEDLKLSPKARDLYPLAIEVKNQEALNIWAALKQAETHVKEDHKPVVFFRRNRSELYVSLKAKDFIWMIR